jgi:hypothetical protein
MDGDRKYRQHGYQDNDRKPGGQNGDQKPRQPQGPRTLQDPSGPRLPRLVQSVAASRCFNCATMLPTGTDFKGECPKCHTSLHCCKQCAHFEPSTRFQCLKPIPARIPLKDKMNECELFSARVTVSRDGHAAPVTPAPAPSPMQVRSPNDARAAFDNLFKK